jgi:hypothetical protein
MTHRHLPPMKLHFQVERSMNFNLHVAGQLRIGIARSGGDAKCTHLLPEKLAFLLCDGTVFQNRQTIPQKLRKSDFSVTQMWSHFWMNNHHHLSAVPKELEQRLKQCCILKGATQHLSLQLRLEPQQSPLGSTLKQFLSHTAARFHTFETCKTKSRLVMRLAIAATLLSQAILAASSSSPSSNNDVGGALLKNNKTRRLMQAMKERLGEVPPSKDRFFFRKISPSRIPT